MGKDGYYKRVRCVAGQAFLFCILIGCGSYRGAESIQTVMQRFGNKGGFLITYNQTAGIVPVILTTIAPPLRERRSFLFHKINCKFSNPGFSFFRAGNNWFLAGGYPFQDNCKLPQAAFSKWFQINMYF